PQRGRTQAPPPRPGATTRQAEALSLSTRISAEPRPRVRHLRASAETIYVAETSALPAGTAGQAVASGYPFDWPRSMLRRTIARLSEAAFMSEPSTRATGARDKPSIFRTYARHSTAHDSNALYRQKPAQGQTGLS